jgi:hypothetical protein
VQRRIGGAEINLLQRSVCCTRQLSFRRDGAERMSDRDLDNINTEVAPIRVRAPRDGRAGV